MLADRVRFGVAFRGLELTNYLANDGKRVGDLDQAIHQERRHVGSSASLSRQLARDRRVDAFEPADDAHRGGVR
jgi:hypothetical protein